MSDLPPPPPPPPPPSALGAAAARACPRCGATAGPDQDWCLNCGTAVTTEVAGAAGWRTPLAIVAAVLLVAAVALVFAFVELSGEADKVAEAPVATPGPAAPSAPPGPAGPTGVTTPTPAPAAPSPPSGPSAATGPTGPTPAPPTGGAVARWPAGRTAYTVILFSETSYASAKSKAATVSSLPGVGILRSGKFSTLRAGYFVVFSNQYDTLEAAQAAAESAQSAAPGAYAKQVKPKD